MTNRVLGSLAAVLTIADFALAHAVLLEANPAPHGWVPGPDVNVKLRFNSRIDSARSRLALVLPDRTIRPVSLQVPSTPGLLAAQVSGLNAGSYTLQWQVLSSGGHITRGEIPFRVK